jgi:hypothetical protein
MKLDVTKYSTEDLERLRNVARNPEERRAIREELRERGGDGRPDTGTMSLFGQSQIPNPKSKMEGSAR